MLAGNLGQFFATRTAGKFRAHLTETYGAVSLIKGFLGVSLVLLSARCLFGRHIYRTVVQKRFLVIHDVKALQAIAVKDQDSYRKSLPPCGCGLSFPSRGRLGSRDIDDRLSSLVTWVSLSAPA